MKAIRLFLTVAVFTAGIIAVHRLCWTRYACDVEKNSADRRLSRAFKQSNETERTAIGRTMLARLRPCLDRDPFDYQLRVTYGMAADAAGQKELAMAMYRAALAFNERPEILANLAELQFETGHPEEAKQNLLRACSLHIAYVRKVGEPMRTEIIEAVKARRARLSAARSAARSAEQKRSHDDPQVADPRP
jgi:tetratricopeptide (TPR) repeat protein